ncbi:unnamed protein product [Phaedon cochleariae]|uniref:Isocitric dehydrogenase subunit beta n=1 Tax=Phaedon cochleariae TaxID=80249 RepID=A0A9P0GNT3_PHACE|nr:unnamed protein product [Phaedon cochleariae]
MFSDICKRYLRTLRTRNSTRNYTDHRIIPCTLVPGDGVGPEMVHSVQEVFHAASVPMEFETIFFSEINPLKSATLEQVASSISRNRVCLHGIVATPDLSATGELQNLNMKLRKRLNLFAQVVHVKSLPGIKSRHAGVDCVIIREQTEGEYSALEHETVKGMVECLKIVTKKKSEEIAKFAFDYAAGNKRSKVTAVHKASIFKLTDGMFLKSCEKMAELYPKIKFQAISIDHCTMAMVSSPQQFDVLVTPNLYGTILENIGAALVGGAGVVAGSSYSSDCVIYEPGARHAFARATGQDIANPTAMLLCGVKLLRHVNLPEYGEMLKKAVLKVLGEGKVRTKDIGGDSTTQEFTKAVIHNLDLHSLNAV